MQLLDIKKKVNDYLRSSFHLDLNDDSANIFEKGGVNSLFFIQLLVFIEKTFDIQLEEGEFDVRKLTSVNAISEMLMNKLAQNA